VGGVGLERTREKTCGGVHRAEEMYRMATAKEEHELVIMWKDKQEKDQKKSPRHESGVAVEKNQF